jgi:predicted nucleic acid-binding protein
MSRIYGDSMIFVYALEAQPEYGERSRILRRMAERGDTLCTSVLTVGEVLTGFNKKNALDQIRVATAFFRPPHVEMLEFDMQSALGYAQIRRDHRLSPADSIHIATAARRGVDLFLTNDHTLTRKIIPGISFIAGLDVNLF